MNGNQFKSIFEQHFPLSTAYEWDNVGLQIGTLNKEITGILITLDLTVEVIEEALNRVNGNKSKAAELLKITRRVLYTKLKKYGIE